MKTRRPPARELSDDRGERAETELSAAPPTQARRDRTPSARSPGTRAKKSSLAKDDALVPVVIPALLAGARTVRFALSAPDATAVYVAGTFNEWLPSATPLSKSPAGEWQCERLLAPGEYEYCFVVDGAWRIDPRAERSIPNPFGGFNSLLTVS